MCRARPDPRLLPLRRPQTAPRARQTHSSAGALELAQSQTRAGLCFVSRLYVTSPCPYGSGRSNDRRQVKGCSAGGVWLGDYGGRVVASLTLLLR